MIVAGLVAIALSTLTATAASASPVDVTRIWDVPYAGVADPDRSLDIYHVGAPSSVKKPAVVVIHGGGWRGGDKNDLFKVANNLAREGYVVFSVNYRLDVRPSGYPVEVDDVETSVTWVRAQAAKYGVNAQRIAILGSSAGANLAAMAAMADDGIKALVSWSGPMDLEPMYNSGVGMKYPVAYLGCEPTNCAALYDSASPVGLVDSGDPPALLLHSDGDAIVPFSQSQIMHETLQRAGVESKLAQFSGTKHGVSLGVEQLVETIAFLDAHV